MTTFDALPPHPRCGAPVRLHAALGAFLCSACASVPSCWKCGSPLCPTAAGWECRTCLAAITRCARCAGTGRVLLCSQIEDECIACGGSGEVLARPVVSEVGDER